jgi:hypothetical protein
VDKQTATAFVERIETHRGKEAAIWQEMRQRPDYAMHEDKSIESILEERKSAREFMESAQSSLDAFDWVDDGTGNFVPRDEIEQRPEPAWPSASASLREALRDNPKALKMIDHIDRLHELAIAKGLPVPSKDELEAEIERLQQA